ncbi:MAG: ABC transporter ATP-binding protein [Chloroflexi bacterium]|nr:MAG: ABC transporter ATP-binding protein [Chloroflexota bacterium]
MYLVLENVYKIFESRGGTGEVTAVDDVSLQIEKGEFVTLLGPSGCGKTTTLRMVAGFEFPTAGDLRLDNKVINNLPPHKRDMSMVFQSYAIFPHLTVFENIAYGLNVKRLPKAEITQRVDRVLDLVELPGFGGRTPEQLSGGQQQRVALARALVMEPKVLLMDEPLSNLDAKLREQMRSEIRRIHQQIGITSMYVTHDQTEAMTMSDRIVVMNEGRIEQVGPPTEIYRRPTSRFVADFIGRANFVDGVVRGVDNGRLSVESLGVLLDVSAASQDFQVGQKVTLVIRPEMALINPIEGAHVSGIVRQSAYLGSTVEYDVEVNGQLLSLVENDPRRTTIFAEGESVQVKFWDECLFVVAD